MWTEGATASQIADELGGVSRNAVIGKAHRLGLEARPSPVKPGEEKEKPSAAAASAPAPKPAPAERAASARDGRASVRASGACAADPPAPAARRSPTTSSIARSVPAASSARARATSRRRSRRLRRAAWSRPSRAPKSPTRPACSISTTASANGRWAIRASPTSISAAMPSNPGFPYCVEHCGVAYQAQLPRRDRRPPPPLPFGGPRVR